MTQHDEYKKKPRKKGKETEATDDTGKGGQGGKIAFRQFITAGGPLRDDLLTTDLRHLLYTHDQSHLGEVKNQRDKRAQRELVKAGKAPLATLREGLGSGIHAGYKSHPTFVDKPQFTTDRNESALPTVNVAETNQKEREKLELTNRPQFVPTFNPKPLIR